MAELTPMKRQYYKIKEQSPDCILFFRLGDFYEMFDDDARLVSRELDLALTTRDRGKPEEEQTPMCGVPFHSSEAYIARLIAKGYKVAICEQLEDPAAATGLVDRGVIRVITPGTVTASSMLEEGRSNYICALWLEEGQGAAAFCDISTGEFCVQSFSEDAPEHLVNELGRFSPKEAVLSAGAEADGAVSAFLRKIDCLPDGEAGRFEEEKCRQLVYDRFGEVISPSETLAAGALLSYIAETQKFDLSHIRRLDRFGPGRYMELDYATRRNLELTENLRTGEKKGSLLWVLDRTQTPMGGRLLRSWVERPLLDPVAIRRRLAAVGELHADAIARQELRLALHEIGDIQRLIGRCVYGTANGRDLLALGTYFGQLPRLVQLLAGTKSALLRQAAALDTLDEVREDILSVIADEPPFSVREGGILRPGADGEVDRLRSVRDNGADMVVALEARERERTGIKKLKVGYNKVFGYYIDVPRSAGDAPLPEDYIRKQTLVSNERYFTPELKELENTLLNAKDRIAELEYQIFAALRDRTAAQVERIQTVAAQVAELDAVCSLAEVAAKNRYVCPEVDVGRTVQITEGRHPVVEQAQKNVLFVPNDTFLNDSTDRVAIITGPNMAGKSTYMRQTALIVLMAQMGSFVPAKSAVIGMVDRVFTRIGASDDLASGQSTFMVEMAEMADILRHATGASLLILDEIGRGTSTFDGMAIARAMLEYCADKRKLGARTMFATHYHELSALEGTLDGVKNYNITAKKQGGSLIFLRKIVPGAADDSYGIEVAKLAGVPDPVIRKAKQYLAELESGKTAAAPAAGAPAEEQVSMLDVAGGELARRLRDTDLNTITPLEALNLLYKLKQEAEGR